MNILPAPPTDNLYKFTTVVSAWLIGLFLVAIVYLIYCSTEVSKARNNDLNYDTSISMIRQFENRLKAISTGNLKDHVLDWVPIKDGSTVEKNFLETARENHLLFVKRYETKPKFDYSTTIQVLNSPTIQAFFMIFPTLATCLFLWGLKSWYLRSQKLNDRLLELDHEIKTISRDSLKTEQIFDQKFRHLSLLKSEQEILSNEIKDITLEMKKLELKKLKKELLVRQIHRR